MNERSVPGPVHFVGAGGAGMSALALLLKLRGLDVSGCDASPDGLGDLTRHGIPVNAGHDPLHAEGATALIVSSAIPSDHPELVHARELGIPVVRRAEALGEAVKGATVVGIAGTHGKTTTTVMTTEALAAAGRNPTGLAGGRVAAWQGNLRPGGSRTVVVEADEFDRSFLALAPTVAVVTNVEADHLDVYRDLADISAAFEEFLAPARSVILCADDHGAARLSMPHSAECLTYGIGDGPRLSAHEILGIEGRLRFLVRLDGAELGEVALQVPGVHNVRNALAAIGSGIALGHALDEVRPGLERFEGVDRRFQRLGTVGGVQVVDDYAHHPTEITATIDAARAAYPGRRLVVAFQPHLFTRTRDFAIGFGNSLAAADVVFLTDIYPSREKPIEGVSAGLVADALRAAGHEAAWQGSRADLAQALARATKDGDVVITLGAGDITRTGPELLHLLAGR